MDNPTTPSIVLPPTLPLAAQQLLLRVGMQRLAAVMDPNASLDEKAKAKRELDQYETHLQSRGGYIKRPVTNPLDVMKGAPEPDTAAQAYEAAQHNQGVERDIPEPAAAPAAPERPDDPNPPQDTPEDAGAASPSLNAGPQSSAASSFAHSYPSSKDTAILAALNDPKPLGADPYADMIKRLSDAILMPQGKPRGRTPLTTGDRIAMGIIAGLDQTPDRRIFREVIMPMLEAERNRPKDEQEAADREHQQQIQSLAALAQIVGTQQQRQTEERHFQIEQEQQVANRQAEEGRFQETQARLNAGEQERVREFNITDQRTRELQAERLAQQKELKAMQAKAAAAKVPPMIQQTHGVMLDAVHAAQAALGMLAEGDPGGPITGNLGATIFSDEAAQLNTHFGHISEGLLRFYQRRSNPEATASSVETVIGGSLPTIKMGHAQKIAATKAALDTALRWLNQDYKLYPILKDVDEGTDESGLAGVSAVQNPTLQPGETDLHLEIPDEAVQ